MLLKVFNKGQVVIPAEFRKAMGVHPGDLLLATWSADTKSLELRPGKTGQAARLAGSLAGYGHGKRMPARARTQRLLEEGLTGGRQAD